MLVVARHASLRAVMTVSVFSWLQPVLRDRGGAARAVGGADTAWEAKADTRVRGEIALEKSCGEGGGWETCSPLPDTRHCVL